LSAVAENLSRWPGATEASPQPTYEDIIDYRGRSAIALSLIDEIEE